jgi:hypothetical protein
VRSANSWPKLGEKPGPAPIDGTWKGRLGDPRDREGSTLSLTNLDLVVYALFRIGGASRKVYTEEIAWECYRIAPERFSWRLPQFKEKGFPDKDIVRVALTDAAKAKHGGLVKGRYGVEISGRGSDGWQLTPPGAKWILEHRSKIAIALGTKPPDVAPREAQRFSKQIRRDPAFQAFLCGGANGVTPYMFLDFLGCTPDAPLRIIQSKFERLLATAQLVQDTDAVNFLEECRQKFTQYFE